jgi:hypothetical protein
MYRGTTFPFTSRKSCGGSHGTVTCQCPVIPSTSGSPAILSKQRNIHYIMLYITREIWTLRSGSCKVPSTVHVTASPSSRCSLILKQNSSGLFKLLQCKASINLWFPAPEQYLLSRVRTRTSPILNMLDLRLSIWQFPIIIQDHMNQQKFQFIAGEEASRTCMLSMPEDIAFWTRGDELMLVLFTWSVPQVKKAMAVELVGVGENARVFH